VGCAFPLAVLGSGRVDTSGDHVTQAGFVYKGGYQLFPEDLDASDRSLVLCPGVAPLYRVSALDSVGGWDTGLQSSFEDVDLSLRLWLAGWQIMPVWETRVVHLQGETSRRNVALREFLMSRNEAIVLFKTVEWGTLVRLLPAHITYLTLSLLSHLFRGSSMPYAAGKLAFVCSISQCLSARRSIVSTRRLGHRLLQKSWLRTWFRLSRLGGRRSRR
jgi:GT2 family glycosyltransferase